MVLQIGKYIHALKLEIANASPLKTILFAFAIIFLEVFLSIISLPLYISNAYIKNYNLFNEEGMSYTLFRKRRRWTLLSFSGICTVLIISIILSFVVNLFHAHAAVNWTERQPAGAADRTWWGLASDSDGSNLIAAVNNGRLYTSSDSGVNWTERQPVGAANITWISVASDADGSNLFVAVNNGRLYKSSNYGVSWSEAQPVGNASTTWVSVASDSDGSNLIAAASSGRLYTSSDSGANWTERQPAGASNQFWISVASDADGSFLMAAISGGRLYTSSDSGANWTERQPAGAVNRAWSGLGVDGDGSNLMASVNPGRLYTSSDSGANWTERQPAGATDKAWRAVATDSTGQHLIAAVLAGRLYTSSDSGVSWTETQPAGAVDKNWRTVASDADGSNLIAGESRLYTGVDTTPIAPSNITTSSVAMTSITVSWTDNSNNETGFILDSSTNGTIYANVTTTGADVTSYQVTSLSGGTSYWFRVAAAGASSNSSYVTTTAATVTPSNSAPTTPASLTATPVRDTTGYITIQFTVNDSEQNVLKVKPEYKSGNCSSYSGQSTTTIAGSITATYGQSDITLTSNEADGYQIQNVTTTPGANTLSFSWNSKSNVPTADGQYCIFITSNDSTVDSTVSSTTVTLDNVYPTAPGSLSVSTSTTSTVTFNLGSVTTETNFSEYKIFYKTGSSGVTTGDTAYTSSSDSNLGSISYNSVTTATVSSLSPNVQYVANIWAYDSYGQYTPASTEVSFYTLANRPTTSTVTATSTSALTLVIGQNSNPSNTEYAICQTSDGYTCASGGNVQSDGSLSSSSAAYQTYAAWGGASGINISGLQSNTAYQFIVKARNGNSVETNYSPANTAVYTYADQVSSPVTTNSTNTTTVRASISFTMPSTLPNGMKIEQDSSCDSSYDTTIYDSSSSNTSSPFLVSGLTANTCYIFRFSSYNNDGVLNTVSRPTASSFTTSPGQVTNVRATSASESQITWSWDAVTAATAYDIYQAITGALLGSVIAPTIEYIQSSLSANTSYSIIVRALNDSGSGIASSIGTAVTNASVPTGVTHSAQTTDSITWGWTNGGQSAFYAQNKDTTSRNSGWIAETSWAETGLSANTQYTVQVKARNSENTETSFTEVAAYTAQNAPSSISFSSVSTTVISVAANGTFPNVGTGSAVIHFDNGAGSTQDMSNTSAWTNTGLSPNTQYTYTAYATNGDGDQTSSVNGSTTTLANTPDVPTVNNASTSSMTVIINLANNPASTEFSICQTSDGTSCASGGNLQANGTLSSSAAAWQSYTAWGGASGISVTGLTTGNGYRFLVKARNSANVQTNYSSASTIVYALSTSPGTPTVESVSQTTLRLYVNQNGNNDSTTYQLCQTTNGTSCVTSGYLQSDGTLSTNSDSWRTYTQWGGSSGIIVSELSVNTAYKFLEKTKDSQGNESDFSTASSWVYTQVVSSATVVSSTSVTITASQPTVVIDGNPDTGLGSTVNSVSIPTTIAPTTAVTLDLSRGLSNQQTTVQSNITITRQSSNSATAYTLFIPSSTIITASSNAWDGKVTLPTNLAASGISTNHGHVQNAVEVGSSIRLDFDKAVKLIIPGGANQSVAYIDTSGNTVRISLQCTSATDASNIVGSGECYFSSGTDMIIWTKHFTTYFTYIPYESLSSSLTPQDIQTQVFVSPNPSRSVVIINGGSRQTATTSISLEFNLVGAATMLISNSSDFVSAIAVPFLSSRSWILTPGNGLKTVYVRFKTADGVSADALGTIQLIGQATDQPKDPDIGTAVIRPEKKFKPQVGTLAKESINPATYIFFADTWHLIATEILFNKLKYSWSWIKTITQEEFATYTIGRPIKTVADSDLPELQQVKKAAEESVISSSSTIDSAPISNSSSSSTRKFNFIFSKNIYPGSTGTDVRSLQDLLSTLGYLKSVSTGYYGLQTTRAVKSFQKEYKIPTTGIVGPKTRGVMNSL